MKKNNNNFLNNSPLPVHIYPHIHMKNVCSSYMAATPPLFECEYAIILPPPTTTNYYTMKRERGREILRGGGGGVEKGMQGKSRGGREEGRQ